MTKELMHSYKQTENIDTFNKGAKIMEPEENGPEPPQPEDQDLLNLPGRAVIAIVLGICIVLIFNILNRGGWFALLSALFGMLLYITLVIVQWVRNPKGTQPASCPVPEAQSIRQAVKLVIIRGLPNYGLRAIVGAVGLYFLPNKQDLVFALISGVLAFLLCNGLFTLGMLVAVLFVGYKEQIGSSGE